MTYTLTTQQLSRMYRSLGVRNMAEPPFTADELNDIYDMSAGDWDVSVAEGLWALLTDRAKFAVYTLGADGLNKQKLFDNLLALYNIAAKRAGLEGGRLRSGTISTGIDMPDFTSFDEFYSNPLLWSNF